MLSRLLCVLSLFLLAACGADHKWASDAEVARAVYSPGPPASLTVITSINTRSGAGAHSALLINGSQRVLYDPAGSWELGDGFAPERNDLHYGITQPVLDSYLTYQSSTVFEVVAQTIEVPLAVADQAIALSIKEGSASKAFCSNSVSNILGQLPGFASVRTVYFPKVLMREIAKLPGVEEKTIDAKEGGHDYLPLTQTGASSKVASN